jgi:uncharacterized protein YkwD
MELAQVRAAEISVRGQYSHIRPDGTTTFGTVVGDYKVLRENITSEEPGGAVVAWSNSLGHRDAMLMRDGSLKSLGVGVYDHYVVQLFGISLDEQAAFLRNIKP